MKYEDLPSYKKNLIINKVKEIQKNYPPELLITGGNNIQIIDAIIVGSYAKGNANEESDLDIMFITDKPIYKGKPTLKMNQVWRKYFLDNLDNNFNNILIEFNMHGIHPAHHVTLYSVYNTKPWGNGNLRLGISLLMKEDIYLPSDMYKIYKKWW